MRYWKRVDSQGQTTTVECYSHDLEVEGTFEISQAEFHAYTDSLPPPKPPPPPEEHHFSPSSQPLDLTGIAQKLDYIETFLQTIYP